MPLLILVEITNLFIFRQILIFLYGCGILVTENCMKQIKGICWTDEAMFSSRSLAPSPLPARTCLSHIRPVHIVDKSLHSVLGQAGSTLGEEGIGGRLQTARLC